MTQNVLQKRGRIWLSLLCVNALMALLLVSIVGSGLASRPGASAGTKAPEPGMYFAPRPWTTVGSTGAVDESALNFYAFTNIAIGFRLPSTGALVVARYNVTNTFNNTPNPNQPAWHTLEMGSNAPPNVIVEAKLYRFKPCNPTSTDVLCSVINQSNNTPCATCQFNPNAFDFGIYLYSVEVTLNRTAAPLAMPSMFTLRIF